MGAAASVSLGFAASKLLEPDSSSQRSGAPGLSELETTRSPDIAPEIVGPASRVEPWVGSAALTGVTPAEASSLEAARAAVSRKDNVAALRLLKAFDTDFPASPLRADASALRIQALSAIGDQVEARVRAEQFLQQYPQHPLAERMKRFSQSP